jgi:hypothetical protein
VTWGDGSGPADATVTGPVDPTPLEPCEYSVAAGHTYALPGSYTLTVDASGGGDPGSATGVVKVADAPIAAGADGGLSGVAGQSLSDVVGTFTAQNTLAPATYYSATVSWGDGSEASASVAAGQSPGQLAVSAQHAYRVAGDYVATVTLTDGDGETSSLEDYIDETDPGVVGGAPVPLLARDGQPLDGPIAQFSTPDTAAPATYYAATIDWGDGSSSAGKIVATGVPGSFRVDARHVYRTAGTMNAVVRVTDGDHESITMSEPVTIDLVSGQLGSVYAPTIQAQQSEQFIGPVMDFGYRGGSAADLRATVHWGDGQTTGANVVELTANPIYGDLYDVDSDHTYTRAGTYQLTVTVRAVDGYELTLPAKVVVAAQSSAHFTLPLDDVRFSPDALGATLTCPSVRVRSGLATLAATYFIIPGHHSATIDLPIYTSQLVALGIHGRTKLQLDAVGLDPSRGRSLIGRVTVVHRFPG